MADRDASPAGPAHEFGTPRATQVAVLDRQGAVRTANDAWLHWAAAGWDDTFPRPPVGADYCATLAQAATEDAARMARLCTRVREVIEGRRRRVVAEYAARGATGVRWLRVKIEPHNTLAEHTVVCHSELAEIELGAARLRWSSRMGGALGAGAVSLDAAGTIVYADNGAAGIHGYRGDELLGCGIDVFCTPQVAATALRPLLARIRRLGQAAAEIEHVRRDGNRFQAETLGYLVRDDVGHDVGFLLSMQDITQRKRAEQALRDSEERFRALVQNGFDPILLLGADGQVRYVSPSIERVIGVPATELLGPNAALEALVYAEDAERVRAAFAEAGACQDGHVTIRYRACHRDGSVRHIEAVIRNLKHVPSVDGLVVNLRDVTERTLLEEALRHQAFHDPLTGLPNRLRFLERLSQALAQGAPGCGPLAVFFLDLDGFKAVNDGIGHAAGDALLLAVSRRLGGCLRPEDIVARFGGDEFAVLTEGIEEPADAMALARRFLAAVRRPVRIEGEEVAVTASIGIALASGGGGEPDELLRRADVALYQAKAAGKGQAIAFHPGDTCRPLTASKRS